MDRPILISLSSFLQKSRGQHLWRLTLSPKLDSSSIVAMAGIPLVLIMELNDSVSLFDPNPIIPCTFVSGLVCHIRK